MLSSRLLLPRPSFPVHSHRISSLGSRCSLSASNISNMKFPVRVPLLGQRHIFARNAATSRTCSPKASEKEPQKSLEITVMDNKDPLLFMTCMMVATTMAYLLSYSVCLKKNGRSSTIEVIKPILKGPLVFISLMMLVFYLGHLSGLKWKKYDSRQMKVSLSKQMQTLEEGLKRLQTAYEKAKENTEVIKVLEYELEQTEIFLGNIQDNGDEQLELLRLMVGKDEI